MIRLLQAFNHGLNNLTRGGKRLEEETALAGNKLPNECTNVAPATVDNIGDTNNNGATDHMLAQQQEEHEDSENNEN